jgi:hypothetical protein
MQLTARTQTRALTGSTAAHLRMQLAARTDARPNGIHCRPSAPVRQILHSAGWRHGITSAAASRLALFFAATDSPGGAVRLVGRAGQ